MRTRAQRACEDSVNFCRVLRTPGFLFAEARDFFVPRMRIAMDCVLDMHPKFSRPLPAVAATTCRANMEPQAFAREAQWLSSIKNQRLELCDFIYYYRFVPRHHPLPSITFNRQIIPSSFHLTPPFLHQIVYSLCQLSSLLLLRTATICAFPKSSSLCLSFLHFPPCICSNPSPPDLGLPRMP